MSETEQANVFLDVEVVIDNIKNWPKGRKEKSSVIENDGGLQSTLKTLFRT